MKIAIYGPDIMYTGTKEQYDLCAQTIRDSEFYKYGDDLSIIAFSYLKFGGYVMDFATISWLPYTVFPADPERYINPDHHRHAIECIAREADALIVFDQYPFSSDTLKIWTCFNNCDKPAICRSPKV